MQSFTYHKAQSLSEARAVYEGADDGLYLAGGMTVLPTLKQRLAMPSDLVDLAALDELSGIEVSPSSVLIGAMTCHHDVACSDEVKHHLPALSRLASGIGDPSVRYRGTLGGSIANNDPAADYPAALLALDATIMTDRREIKADDFFIDLFETALEDGELIKAVKFEIPRTASYEKFSNPASRYAVVGVFVAQFAERVRVAVTGAAPCVFRAQEMEEALEQRFLPEAIEMVRISADDLNDDMHASAGYRAHLVSVMAGRAVRSASVT